MALLRRNKADVTAVPKEVQDYYQSERRDRKGVAWVLAILTLIATLALAAGIFFAGRWAYRAITGSGDTQQTTPAETVTDQNGQTGTSSTNTTTPSTSGETVNSDSQSVTSTNSTDTSQPGSTTSGVDTLVNTGPGDTIAIFLVVTAGVTLLHYVLRNRRLVR